MALTVAVMYVLTDNQYIYTYAGSNNSMVLIFVFPSNIVQHMLSKNIEELTVGRNHYVPSACDEMRKQALPLKEGCKESKTKTTRA